MTKQLGAYWSWGMHEEEWQKWWKWWKCREIILVIVLESVPAKLSIDCVAGHRSCQIECNVDSSLTAGTVPWLALPCAAQHRV